jgi:hypothetical protein
VVSPSKKYDEYRSEWEKSSGSSNPNQLSIYTLKEIQKYVINKLGSDYIKAERPICSSFTNENAAKDLICLLNQNRQPLRFASRLNKMNLEMM